jgi:Flp pilus assembly pilin Flp
VSRRRSDEAIRTMLKLGLPVADNATMDWIVNIVRRLQFSTGQTMAEYALLIAVIALIVIVAASLMGGNVSSALHSTANYL